MELIALPPFLSHHFSLKGARWEAFAVRIDEFCVDFLVKARLDNYTFYLARKVGRLEILLDSCRKPSFPVGILSSCRLLCYLLGKKKTHHLPYVKSQPVGKVLQPQSFCSHLDTKSESIDHLTKTCCSMRWRN